MSLTKKIISFIVLISISTSSLYAYDLTDKEKSKWDLVYNKIMLVINKKPEEKREKYKKQIITKLELLQERARNKEKLASLIWYITEKMKTWTGKIVNTRYPGCDKDDIVLSNWQIWSSCDVWSTRIWEIWEYFAWWSMKWYKDLPSSGKEIGSDEWNEKNPQGPCKTGYHIPNQADFEKAISVTKTQSGGLSEVLSTKNKFYWTSTYNPTYDWAYNTFSNFENSIYFGSKWNFFPIRCIKD